MRHRWSGWPGAWCLDCGIEDPFEIALLKTTLTDGLEKDTIATLDIPECPTPNSNKFNPYIKKKEK